ncbi:hypothetical protein CALVIDRAFT_215638 [Calocera viscosa TUFC12733]|uniref:Uncharacterized protein n=1 Tax=Calocera viscosa (strain TUFC12733) TaxID=1330018 RepID=A0A167RFQ2_CALVF|nr:hypothetical protein CALVIDRAFT_215638 [Calocera viscosa TUFC12733]
MGSQFQVPSSSPFALFGSDIMQPPYYRTPHAPPKSRRPANMRIQEQQHKDPANEIPEARSQKPETSPDTAVSHSILTLLFATFFLSFFMTSLFLIFVLVRQNGSANRDVCAY